MKCTRRLFRTLYRLQSTLVSIKSILSRNGRNLRNLLAWKRRHLQWTRLCFKYLDTGILDAPHVPPHFRRCFCFAVIRASWDARVDEGKPSCACFDCYRGMLVGKCEVVYFFGSTGVWIWAYLCCIFCRFVHELQKAQSSTPLPDSTEARMDGTKEE